MEILLDKKWNRDVNRETLSNILVNASKSSVEWDYTEVIEVKREKGMPQEVYLSLKAEQIRVKGRGAGILINGFFVPIEAELCMPIILPVKLKIKMKVFGESEIHLDSLRIICHETRPDLTKCMDDRADLLVVTQDNFPPMQMYTSIKARVMAYQKAGWNVQIASISNEWFQMKYKIDGINVLKGDFCDLKNLLKRKNAKVIVSFCASEEFLQIYDGYVQEERIIFIYSGIETLNGEACEHNGFYPGHFQDVQRLVLTRQQKLYIEKYALKNRVTWTFFCQCQKEQLTKKLGIKFSDAVITVPIVDQTRFVYYKKSVEARKRVAVILKPDDWCHAIDLSIFAIRELSRRPCFADLQFYIYAMENCPNDLLDPIKEFSNVHIEKEYIQDRMPEICTENGIFLFPSRYDMHLPVIMDAAAAGMAVVGIRSEIYSYFLDEKENHTLAEDKNPMQLADIIERLYQNPQEYLAVSERMSKKTIDRCCADSVLESEFRIIRQTMKETGWTVCQNQIRSDHPVLTVAVPAYNVEQYVEKCLFSLVNHKWNDRLEILFINDGSKDKTLKKAKDFIRKSGAKNITVIDKENGGHGSAINKGIELAKGKYIRMVDGDDWVDSANLAKQIQLLENLDVDLMLTKGCYEYVQRGKLENIVEYNTLCEGMVYQFDDLTYPAYGFSEYGPLLATAAYRTEVLRKAGFKLSEKKPYVDMEFNSYSLKYIHTVVYYDLDIYRYLIGREGQTVSKDFWKKKYQDHEAIIFNICEYVQKEKGLSANKKKYIAQRIVARMVDSQIFMYDQITKWEELDEFLKKLKQYGKIYGISIQYVKSKRHDSWKILKYYRVQMKNMQIFSYTRRPIICGESGRNGIGYITKAKQAAKWIVPYEMAVRISQRFWEKQL